MRSVLGTGIVALLLLAGASAHAGSVYLNGVDIDGAGQPITFKKVNVRVDAKGNVYIDAPGYKVLVQTTPTQPSQPTPAAPAPSVSPTSSTVSATLTVPTQTAPQPAAQPPTPTPSTAQMVATPDSEPPPGSTAQVADHLTRHYWLVAQQSAPGMTQYDIDVYLNSQWLRRLRSDDGQVQMDITKKLVPGKNTVLFRAHKVMDGQRKSFSADHVFKVIIGAGIVGGDQLFINEPLVEFARNAAQTDDVTQEYTFTAR